MIDSVVVIVLLFVAFALIHSILVADRTKLFMTKLIGVNVMQRYYRLFFTIVSLASLIFLSFVIYNLPDRKLLILGFPFDFIFRSMQIIAVLLLIYAGRNFDFLEFIGLKQIYTRKNQDTDIEGLKKTGLITSGAYSIVRHPMYLAGILIFSFNPVITVNSIVITILADAYLVFGAWIESKRYLKLYGDEYRQYSQKVPMILPFKKFF